MKIACLPAARNLISALMPLFFALVCIVEDMSSANANADLMTGVTEFSISLAELDNLLTNASLNTDVVQAERYSILSARLAELPAASPIAGSSAVSNPLTFANGQLTYHDLTENLLVDGGCNNTYIRSLDTTLTITGNSALTLSAGSIYDPVTLSLNLFGLLQARGNARQTIAIDLGGCQTIAVDNMSITGSGPFHLQLELQLYLNPVWLDATTLQFSPKVQLNAVIPQSDITIEVDDSLVAGIVEDLLDDKIDQALDPQGLEQRFAQLQQQLQLRLLELQPDGVFQIVLPDDSNPRLDRLLDLLASDARFSVLLDYLHFNRVELLAGLLLGDSAMLQQLLESASVCQTASSLLIDEPPRPLYRWLGQRCEAGNPSTSDNDAWYADTECRLPVAFQATDLQQWCQTSLDPGRLGNGSALGITKNRWRLSPSTRFDIGALPLTGTDQPYLKSLVYKTVYTEQGECSLEMRIHAAAPRSYQPLRPLFALHGGSWQNRSTGVLGLEALIPQFTDAGFVVFAPFYRLLGDGEGNTECSNATYDELLSDVESALTWVGNNAAYYGATGKPVLFGQSAGGQLAARLAVDHPQDVLAAVLLYAPVDFSDLLAQLNDGSFVSPPAERVVEAVTGSPVGELDGGSLLVFENTLPAKVAEAPTAYPPLYLLHGNQDTLVPARQSVRLCNAMSGDLEMGPANQQTLSINSEPMLQPAEPANAGIDQPLRQIVACDSRGSQLHLFEEGAHALDFCLVTGFCRSGSEASAALVAESLQMAVEWARGIAFFEENLTRGSDQPQSGSSAGTGADLWLVWLLLVFSHVWVIRFWVTRCGARPSNRLMTDR